VTAIDVAALQAHSRNRPTALDDDKKNKFGCDFSGWYSFGKITKTVATRCYILKLKCTKFDLSCGSAADPLEELTVLPDLLAGFKRSYF